MTDLINQITINGETTTFLNYVNPVVSGELSPGASGGVSTIANLITAHLGAVGGQWNYRSAFSDSYSIRFPVPWETLTGSVSASLTARVSDNARVCAWLPFAPASATAYCFNSSNSTITRLVGEAFNFSLSSFRNYVFGFINDYSMCIVGFSAESRSSAYWEYIGWTKDPQFDTSSVEFPCNLVLLNSLGQGLRVPTENSTGASTTSLLTQNPTLSCITPTTNADSSDVIIRDSTAPNNYIGKLWNMMVLPSSAVVGKIYRNTGIDPDTGVVETDQKAYWMCVGSWGTDKIGMRVWTENII